MTASLLVLDKKLFLFLNGALTAPFLDMLMPFLTKGVHWLPLLLLFLILFWRKQGNRPALWLFLGALFLIAISDLFSVRVLKPFFNRERPCDPDVLMEGGRFLVGRLRSLSTPSSHAFNSMALALYLSTWTPRFRFLLIACSLLIGYTRVYVGVHYPFDVALGWLLGGGLGFLFGKALHHFLQKEPR